MAEEKAIKAHADSRQYYKYHVSVRLCSSSEVSQCRFQQFDEKAENWNASVVSFRNRGSCSPDCHDWSVFVQSSPLYKRAHGEDIFICTREMRMGWLPGRLLNRLSRAKMIVS
ncbi:hypothetical protein D917_03160 [Trichinella nativa]|uniref:Uncharacterized protein n=1 Tax=Trichinella nativa TaxID=6335 RepID=A0A1Y3ED52_9BILA|nr:hypothetical protein D917_03160 [Trichinella nativa]